MGLINPIRVRRVQQFVSGRIADAYEITAGGHRYEAVLKLCWETVSCDVVDDDDLTAQLVTIDENLMRTELNPVERAKHTTRRKAIYEEKYPETRPTSEGGEGRHKKTRRQLGEGVVERFTADTAAKSGKSERAVQRDAERGAKIADDVLDRINGTKLGTGEYLDELKRLPKDKQMARVERDLVDTRILEAKRGNAPTEKEREKQKRQRRQRREQERGEEAAKRAAALLLDCLGSRRDEFKEVLESAGQHFADWLFLQELRRRLGVHAV